MQLPKVEKNLALASTPSTMYIPHGPVLVLMSTMGATLIPKLVLGVRHLMHELDVQRKLCGFEVILNIVEVLNSNDQRTRERRSVSEFTCRQQAPQCFDNHFPLSE